jgi:hypothetical protein
MRWPDAGDVEPTAVLAWGIAAIGLALLIGSVANSYVDLSRLSRLGPWAIAVALPLACCELITAKFDLLPEPTSRAASSAYRSQPRRELGRAMMLRPARQHGGLDDLLRTLAHRESALCRVNYDRLQRNRCRLIAELSPERNDDGFLDLFWCHVAALKDLTKHRTAKDHAMCKRKEIRHIMAMGNN